MRRRRSPAADLAAQNQKGRDQRDGHNREETIDVIERKHGCLCLHRFVDHSESLLLPGDNLRKVLKAQRPGAFARDVYPLPAFQVRYPGSMWTFWIGMAGCQSNHITDIQLPSSSVMQFTIR